MNKIIFLSILIISAIILYAFITKKGKPISSIHQFKAKTIEGADFDFASLKGKKILIVNTASKCGFTPQYKELKHFLKPIRIKFIHYRISM